MHECHLVVEDSVNTATGALELTQKMSSFWLRAAACSSTYDYAGRIVLVRDPAGAQTTLVCTSTTPVWPL